MRKFLTVAQAKGAGLGPRQIRVRASDGSRDRDGDILDPLGCDLSSYRTNPIVLANHDQAFPIGTAALAANNLGVEGIITFAPEGTSPKADEVCALAKSGVLSGVSVGFLPLESEPLKGGGRHFTKWSLLELSVVSIPSNAGAVVLERSALGKSGRVLSAKNRECLKRAHGLIRDAGEEIFGLLGQDDDPGDFSSADDDLDGDGVLDKAARQRIARIRQYLARREEADLPGDRRRADYENRLRDFRKGDGHDPTRVIGDIRENISDGIDAIAKGIVKKISANKEADAKKLAAAIEEIHRIAADAKLAFSQLNLKNAAKDFNPNQPRDDHGRWSGGGSSSSGGSSTSAPEPSSTSDRLRGGVNKIAMGAALVGGAQIAALLNPGGLAIEGTILAAHAIGMSTITGGAVHIAYAVLDHYLGSTSVGDHLRDAVHDIAHEFSMRNAGTGYSKSSARARRLRIAQARRLGQ